MSVVSPTYPGHWPYLQRSVQLQLNSTEQPDQIVIASSELDLEQGKRILKTLTELPYAEERIVVVGTICGDNAANNRNKGTAQARMKLVTLADADDEPHMQRNEIVRYVHRHYNFSIFAHATKRFRDGISSISCISSQEELENALYPGVWQRASANGTKKNLDVFRAPHPKYNCKLVLGRMEMKLTTGVCCRCCSWCRCFRDSFLCCCAVDQWYR